jgi:hypothetical protein
MHAEKTFGLTAGYVGGGLRQFFPLLLGLSCPISSGPPKMEKTQFG